MIITSGYNIEGYEIVEYLGHISAQTVLGTGFLSTLSAAVADFLGDNSTKYENKLYIAEKNTKIKLEEMASSMHGDAIIGIDVDYTTFTNDVMGVIVGGTVVKIKKIEKIQESEIYSLPSTLFSVQIPVRCLGATILHLRKEKMDYIKVSGKMYGDKALTGICASLKLRTMFNDIIEIPGVMFTNIIIQSTGDFSTEYVELEIEPKLLKAIQSVECHVQKYVVDNEVVSLDEAEYTSVEIDEEMKSLRLVYGQDAICKIEKKDDSWRCVCGKENQIYVKKCSLCGREPNLDMLPNISKVDEETFIFSDHCAHMFECNSAMQIKQYLLTLPCKDDFFRNKVMDRVEEAVKLERIKGNMKDILIKSIEKLYE